MTSKIRNISIIAHIDHGKTTLVDRFIQICAKDKKLLNKERITDTMQLEQEKGITIKMQPITLKYRGYTINIIDTPGHVDFAYEVSRALRAVEAAVLLVDVTQGIQAQTIENLLKALEEDLTIIPVLNKIDLADKELINQRIKEIESILGFKGEEILLTSAKTGEGVKKLLDTITEKTPLPKKIKLGEEYANDPVALVIDAKYDNYHGVILYVRVFNSTIKPGMILSLKHAQIEFKVDKVGIFTPFYKETSHLSEGEVGFVVTKIKDPTNIYIGDTVTTVENPFTIKGYKSPSPKVFSSFYPAQEVSYIQLKDALYKLKLNDFALDIKEDSSKLLGKGFRLGFLGMLHLEIVKERLKREFGVNVIHTYPTVPYKIKLRDGKTIVIRNISDYPEEQKIERIYEPFIEAEIITPFEYLSDVLDLIRINRGILNDSAPLTRAIKQEYYKVKALIPFSEVIENFFNKLKSISHGYASLSYENIRYLPQDATKITILINREPYEALSFITHPQKAEARARKILRILKETLDRTIVPIPLQASVRGRIIARETIPALKKNVTAKLYGGDVRRKIKLLRKQAKLKKYRAQFIKVKIPTDFIKRVLE